MDKIIIENLVIYAYHGVKPEEKKLGQRFIISCELETDTHNAGTSDDLTQTVNYSKASKLITRLATEQGFDLIETLAEHLAKSLLLEYPLLTGVRMTVKKPWAPIGLPLDYAGVTIYRRRHTAFLSIGSNMGDKKGYLDFAVSSLSCDPCVRVEKTSSYIETAPVGEVEQDDFLNACIKITTIYTPHELLDKIHEIEQGAGSERKIHWGPRTLDIDIILFDNLIFSDETLTIPHIEAVNRSFVLEPLAEIEPYAYFPTVRNYAVFLAGGKKDD